MDLTTTYLGMTLRTPLVPSASPLTERLENIKRMEDLGASAIVLHSLFEEQLHHERPQPRRIGDETLVLGDTRAYSSEGPHPSEGPYPSGGQYFPRQSQYARRPEAYLEHIRKAKEATSIPIIASLNGTSMGGWTEYAKQIEQAGADALELNIYHIPTEPHINGADIEHNYIDIVEAVRSAIYIPLAVKLGPYFSSMANMAWRLERAGADALVLFNRFYQPDINLELLDVKPHILLSTPQALRLPLRWIAILHGRIHTDFAASGGIHSPFDVVKMLLVGANVTMLCSSLLKLGISHIAYLERELDRWMEKHEFSSVREMQGQLSQERSANPAAFERAHYIRTLQSYKPTGFGAVVPTSPPGSRR